MERVSTKDRILDAALTLFAEKGYDGVGVDLIAAGAEIKGPSLYKHFKGKEDILDALIEKAEVYYASNFGTQEKPGKIPETLDELIEISMKRIQFTLHDPMVRKVRRLLAMEQFRNQRIAELATLHNITGIQQLYKTIFIHMIEKGILRENDPAVMAMAFAAPISLLIQLCDRDPDREPKVIEQIEAHLKYFAEINIVQTDGETTME